jgi:hypothetical protein
MNKQREVIFIQKPDKQVLMKLAIRIGYVEKISAKIIGNKFRESI